MAWFEWRFQGVLLGYHLFAQSASLASHRVLQLMCVCCRYVLAFTTLLDLSTITEASDAEVEALARTWRASAARGEAHAFGTAHQLEVELRRRRRTASMVAAPPAAVPARAARRWWQFWGNGARADAAQTGGDPL